MIAALGIDAPDYRHALAISAFGQWSLQSVTRAVAHQGDAAGLPNPMAGENSVRPPTQAVFVP